MGWINVRIGDDLHSDLKNLANQHDGCPDNLKDVIREALADYNTHHRHGEGVGGDE